MTERFGQRFVMRRAPKTTSEAMDTQEAERVQPTVTRSEGPKRRQITDGACRVFLERGFDAASMGEIAREARVSKGTLYVYFKSKEELFEAIVEEQCNAQAEQI